MKHLLSSVAFVAVAALSGAVAAQGFDAQSYRPLPSQGLNYGATASALTLGHLEWEAGGVLNYAHGGLAQRDASGDIVHRPIQSMLTLDALGSIGLLGELEIGLHLPIHLVTNGDDAPAGTDFLEVDGGTGLGDLRLLPKYRFFSTARGDSNDGFHLAGQLAIVLPTGNRDAYRGGGFQLEPRVIAELAPPGPFRAAVNLGYLMRDQAYFGDGELEVDDAITWGIGVGLDASDTVSFVLDVHGEIGYASVSEGTEPHPIEGLIGANFNVGDALVNVRLGRGLSHGFGSPDFRFAIGAAFGRATDLDRDDDGLPNGEDECPDRAEDFDLFEDEDGCPDLDNDGDGVEDRRDRCPLEPEDVDGFEDNDGCPDTDNDADGILDADDACPDEPEDVDLFEDDDGCPEPDNDGDGVLDADDRCVNQPEDLDGFEDEDGCADLDNDDDDIADADDACPDEPEVINGIDDADGCPDEGGVTLQRGRDDVAFTADFGWFVDVTSNLTPEATAALGDLAIALNAYPELTVEVRVVTRDRAEQAGRLAVATRRTAAIRDALVAAGVAIERISEEPVAADAGSTGPGYEVELSLDDW